MIRTLSFAMICALAATPAAAQGAGGWGKPASQPASPPASQPASPAPEKPAAAPVAKIDALRDAVAEAWQAGPLTQRRALFVAGPPEGYGTYTERDSNVFKPGEKIVTYVEPIGYMWTPAPGGMFKYGLAVDFLVKKPDGKVLGGQEKFLDVAKTSHVRNQELMLVMSLKLDGFPPGDYAVEYTIRDAESPKKSTFTQLFSVKE